MRYPGKFPKGTVIDEMLSAVDFMPTILDIAGAEVPTMIDGHSFLPLIEGKAYRPHRCLYAEITCHHWHFPIRALRTMGFKYIRNFSVAPTHVCPSVWRVGTH